jgi:hypothetical protein
MPWSASTRGRCGASFRDQGEAGRPAGEPSTEDEGRRGGSPRATTSVPGATSRISRTCEAAASRTPPAEKSSALRSEGRELTGP